MGIDDREDREAACRAWRAAYDLMDRNDSPDNIKAEQKVYETYKDICDELGECIEPGCHAKTPDHVNCKKHRVN